MLKNRHDNRNSTHNNRINVLIAIVFLFAAALVGRLFYLQVLKYNYYLTVANNQQQTEKVLIPERGKIYLVDDQDTTGNGLYPLATNKQFALIYAVPHDIKSPDEAQDIANKLFFVFDQANVETQVDADFAKSDQAELAAELAPTAGLAAADKAAAAAAITHQYNLFHNDKTWLLNRNSKRNEAIDNVKKSEVAAYLEILSRSDSQYAPLEKRSAKMI